MYDTLSGFSNQDDIRIVPRATFAVLDRELLGDYIERLKRKKVNLSSISNEVIYELMSITRDGSITLARLCCFADIRRPIFHSFV